MVATSEAGADGLPDRRPRRQMMATIQDPGTGVQHDYLCLVGRERRGDRHVPAHRTAQAPVGQARVRGHARDVPGRAARLTRGRSEPADSSRPSPSRNLTAARRCWALSNCWPCTCGLRPNFRRRPLPATATAAPTEGGQVLASNAPNPTTRTPESDALQHQKTARATARITSGRRHSRGQCRSTPTWPAGPTGPRRPICGVDIDEARPAPKVVGT
jgi:hypothetical protein